MLSFTFDLCRYDELIRLGFSRVEDLKLLQGVVDGHHSHKLGLGEQVALEAWARPSFCSLIHS